MKDGRVRSCWFFYGKVIYILISVNINVIMKFYKIDLLFVGWDMVYCVYFDIKLI